MLCHTTNVVILAVFKLSIHNLEYIALLARC